MNKGKVTAIIGAQYGSEGKGVVCRAVAHEYDLWVRVGGPNAGHSFVYHGELFKMQCLPSGWVNPKASLVFGAGAVINLDVLERELAMVEKIDPDIRRRVFIDSKCTVITNADVASEGHTKGELHKRIGSTGEGVGAARIGHIKRDPVVHPLFGEVVRGTQFESMVTEDIAGFLAQANNIGQSICLEGTQGCGLSLIHGKWPYVTSGDTNAGQLLVDAGLAPSRLTNVILVARTFPIRVAGNSGPLANERTWDEMSEHVGKPVVEKTTVTKLVRRIGAWDESLVEKAVILNAPTSFALTFADYLSPEDADKTEFSKLSDKTLAFVDYLERRFQTPVEFVGTGFSPDTGWVHIDRRGK